MRQGGRARVQGRTPTPTDHSPRRSRGNPWLHRNDWSPPWVARLVALLGVISIISAIFPPARGRLELLVEVAPTFAPPVASGATAAAGLLMLNLSGGLRRRKRRAWQVGVAVSASLVVLHLGKGVDVEETCLAATALTVLLMTQRAFIGRADPRARRQILVVSVGGATICASAEAAVVLSNLNDVIGQVTPTDVLRHIGLGLLGLPGPLQFVSAATDLKVATTLVLLGATIALLALATALRPASAPKAIDASDSALVRDLLARAGTQDSMAYFALRDDKCLMVAPSGRAAIAYRVVSGVSLASGDPVGEHESWGEAIDAWLEQARDHAWT